MKSNTLAKIPLAVGVLVGGATWLGAVFLLFVAFFGSKSLAPKAQVYVQQPQPTVSAVPKIPETSGVYQLDLLPQSRISIPVHNPDENYIIQALLKNDSGGVVTNQEGVSYVWAIGDLQIAQIQPEAQCSWFIQEPCPDDRLVIHGLKPGNTTINVTVFKNTSQGKRQINQGEFELNVY